MAQKKKNIITRVNPHGSIHVWSDLTEDLISRVDGVSDVYRLRPSLIAVDVDPRYDSQDVADEIEALVNKPNMKPVREQLDRLRRIHVSANMKQDHASISGEFGHWIPVTAGLPDPGVFVVVKRASDDLPKLAIAKRIYASECFAIGQRYVYDVLEWTPIPL